jgi:hypothetical protein
MHPTSSLSKGESEGKVDQKLYRGMIGSLLYLTASSSDILFSVCLFARFQSDPRESHFTAVKRIFRYLKATCNIGLLYQKSDDYKLIGLCDADYAGDKLERKSTSGNCQFISENLISWASKRQTTIAFFDNSKILLIIGKKHKEYKNANKPKNRAPKQKTKQRKKGINAGKKLRTEKRHGITATNKSSTHEPLIQQARLRFGFPNPPLPRHDSDLVHRP